MQQSHREIISGSAVEAENHSTLQVDWSGLLSELQTSPQETIFTFTSDCKNNCKHLKSVNFRQVEVLFRWCDINDLILICSLCASKVLNVIAWLIVWLHRRRKDLWPCATKTPAPFFPACLTLHWHESEQMPQVGCKMQWGLKKKKQENVRNCDVKGRTNQDVYPQHSPFVRTHQVTATCDRRARRLVPRQSNHSPRTVSSRWRCSLAKTETGGQPWATSLTLNHARLFHAPDIGSFIIRPRHILHQPNKICHQ